MQTDDATENARETHEAGVRKQRPPKNWRPRFLELLSKTGNVTLAAKLTPVGRKSVYSARDRSEVFARAWDEAMDQAADALEAEARRRAVQGTERPVYYKGEIVGAIREYSDTLLIFLLKGARPEKFRENWKIEHGGAGGGPIQFEDVTEVEVIDPEESAPDVEDEGDEDADAPL